MFVRLSTRSTSRWPRRPELLQMQPPFVARRLRHCCHTPAPQTPTQIPAPSTSSSGKVARGLFCLCVALALDPGPSLSLALLQQGGRP